MIITGQMPGDTLPELKQATDKAPEIHNTTLLKCAEQQKQTR